MSRFYGEVAGGRGEATRCGHKYLTVKARSYSGDVRVHMYGGDDVDRVSIHVTDHDGNKRLVLYDGPVAELLDANKYGVMIRALGPKLLETEAPR